MKKTLFLIVALGVAASALPLKAVDVYITGSTAFRKQVYTACQKLFVGSSPTITFADAAHGGSSSGSGAGSWCMTGTAGTNLTAITGTLNIHGLFTGSIQGIQSVENQQALIWVTPASTYTTNAPDLAFDDASSVATPSYDVNKNPGTLPCLEETVAIQPFVFVKSVPTSGAVTNITNITWEQMRYLYGAGRIGYSSWTSKATDTNTYIYLINRTLDSGSRVTTLSEFQFAYNASATVYNYDPTNHGFYLATNELFSVFGQPGYGVLGATGPGNGNANLAWGPGNIGGSDVRVQLQYQDSQNQSVGYLSFSDAQTVNTNAGANWKEVLSYNGIWPTTDGANITLGATTTNNFSPIIYGAYPFWGYEVAVYPNGANNPTIPGCTTTQLGDQNTPGTFLGVLDYQTLYSNPGGSTLYGSLENEIELSKSISPGATALRLSDMTASRGAVGGALAPTPNP